VSGRTNKNRMRAWLSMLATALLIIGVQVAGAPSAAAADPVGTLRGWGLNSSGQVGDGTTERRLTPTPVLLSGIRAVHAGGAHNLAITNDRTVRAWGSNTQGQIGDGSTVDRPTPVRVAVVTNVTAVRAGGVHSLAMTSDGSVWAWGLNREGQLGNGGTAPSLVPVRVRLPLPATLITAGDSHNLAVLNDGSLWAWGRNDNGQLGIGSAGNDQLSPVRVTFPGQLRAVEAGREHTIASRTDSTVFAWGDNSVGQLGDGTANDQSTPRQVPGLTNVIQISAGTFHNLVRRGGSPRTAWGWGRNDSGQVGDGTTVSPRRLPVLIPGMVNPNSVRAGGFHSLGQQVGGTVRAWGNNTGGQLGDGTLTNRSTPVLVPGITNSLVDLAPGGQHSITLAVLS
jgi:alpha-tubulin suppressor-like RCC1 family protein